MDTTSAPTQDDAITFLSVGSDGDVQTQASRGPHPPKKRRAYVSLKKHDSLAAPSSSATVPVPSNMNMRPSSSFRMDLDALTYYPARESSFRGVEEKDLEEPKKAPVKFARKKRVALTEKSMRTAIRKIAKQRRRRLRTMF